VWPSSPAARCGGPAHPQSCTACAPPEPARLGGGRAPYEGVRIGEAGNLVKLTSAEWNVLVRAIQAGELKEI